jgi:branched-chain amino acid transport system permease protein
MVIVGGLGTLWGPLLGAVLIVFLQQFVSIYVQRWMTLLGVLFVLVVLFARTGLWGGMLNLVLWVTKRYGAAPPAAATRAQVADLGQIASTSDE